jgi:hypothetical protein
MLDPRQGAHPQAMSDAELRALFDKVSNWGRWGADDERGTLNYIGAPEVVRAAGLVREGRTVSLSRNFPTAPGPENPWPAQHHMVIAGDDPCVPGIEGLEASTDYIGIAFHGMASSHVDALCHVFAQGRMYNGHPAADVKSTGARRNTIMAMRDGVVGRGVLLDMPRALAARFCDPARMVTVAELERAERSLGQEVGRGDLVMIRLGRDVRRAEFADQVVPGLDPRWSAGCTSARSRFWAATACTTRSRRASCTATGRCRSTCWAGRHGPAPAGQPRPRALAAPAPNSDAGFQLVAAPLRIEGGTGSPLNPSRSSEWQRLRRPAHVRPIHNDRYVTRRGSPA